MSKPRWLIFFGNTSIIDESFKLVNLPFDCQVMASVEDKDLAQEILTEVYRVDKDMELKTKTSACWNEKSGLRVTAESFYSTRKSLDGKNLKVATLNVSPFRIYFNNYYAF